MKLLKAMTMQERFVKLLDVKLICILTLVVFFMSANAYGEPEEAISQYIKLTPYAGKHLAGQSVTITGEYYNSNNEFLEEVITIKYFDTKTDRGNVDELHSNTVFSNNGKFTDRSFIPPEPGIYLVVAESEMGTDNKYQIHAVDFTSTTSFGILIVTISAFVGLLGIMGFIDKEGLKISIYHVARFTFITIIAFGMVSFFIVSDIEYGVNSSVGIVIKEHITSDIGNEESAAGKKFSDQLKLDWVLHIGGLSGDNYAAGLKIPIYILIFGVFGGYLRFFYFTANPWLRPEMLRQLNSKPELIETDPPRVPARDPPRVEIEDPEVKFKQIMDDAYDGVFHPTLARVLTNRVMSDLSLLFIAPVLAVMMFFVISQSGLNEFENPLPFAVASFVAGLFTETVITKLSAAAKKDLPQGGNQENN